MSSVRSETSLSAGGTSPLAMRVRQPLDDGGLADARLAREDRVVLPPCASGRGSSGGSPRRARRSASISFLRARSVRSTENFARASCLPMAAGAIASPRSAGCARGRAGPSLLRRSGDDRREPLHRSSGAIFRNSRETTASTLRRLRRLDDADDRRGPCARAVDRTSGSRRASRVSTASSMWTEKSLTEVDSARQAIEGLEQVARDLGRCRAGSGGRCGAGPSRVAAGPDGASAGAPRTDSRASCRTRWRFRGRGSRARRAFRRVLRG